jgi:hypothetical protein
MVFSASVHPSMTAWWVGSPTAAVELVLAVGAVVGGVDGT